MTSIACILERPDLRDVRLPFNSEWFDTMATALADEKITPAYFRYGDGSAGTPTGYSVACGPGPRGIAHCGVALHGAWVHDPHPSDAGLIRIDDYIALLPDVTCPMATVQKIYPPEVP